MTADDDREPQRTAPRRARGECRAIRTFRECLAPSFGKVSNWGRRSTNDTHRVKIARLRGIGNDRHIYRAATSGGWFQVIHIDPHR